MTLLPPDTARLTFRPLKLEDIENLQVIFTDPVAMRYWPGLKSEAEIREAIEINLAKCEKFGHGFWAVCLRSTEEFLGRCGILHQELRASPDKEIGYAFQRRFWGQGYATEAARAVKEAAFHIFDFPYVVSYIRPENEPSIRVARRNGMELEEVLAAEANNWKVTLQVYSVHRPPSVVRET